MLPPTLISDLITELMGAGLKQEVIAKHLGVKRPLISQYKAGDAYPRDEALDALAALAQLHLGKEITTEDLKVNKWLYWVMREKGLSIETIRRAVGQIDRVAA